MDAFLIGAVVGSFALCGFALVLFCANAISTWADRKTREALTPPPGSLQAIADDLRAMGEQAEQVWAAPRRRNGGGWIV